MVSVGNRLRESFAYELPVMRLTEDARKSVVFLGHIANPDDETTFVASATGFFVNFEGVKYLVTAAHVAVALGDDPFQMRLNRVDDGAGLVHFDPTTDPMDKWFLHPDPTVDVAIIAFPFGFSDSGWDHMTMAQSLLLTDGELSRHDVGPGDTCYAVGLFRLLQGKQRNLPIVHRGSVAAMPSDELIPVKNWRGSGTSFVRAYLVEATNLRGLSGSPVLIRPTINVIADRLVVDGKGENAKISRGNVAGLSAPSCDVSLLGIWSGSWDAHPDEVLSLDRGQQVRVPIGLGVVVPASRLIELLSSDGVKAQRQELWDKYGSKAAGLGPAPAPA